MSAADPSPTPAGDARFLALLAPGTAAEKIAGGFRFLEGPAWHPAGAYLLFSDIPAGKIFRFDASGVSVWRDPSQHSNGNFFTPDGTLYTCEHGARRVSRTPPGGGSPVTVAEAFEGKPLNSPNDIVVQRDGTIWFTDPTYGLEGRKKEQRANFVFRLAQGTGELRAMAGEEFGQPNGLCFSPDERRLYVADSDSKRHNVRVYDVAPDGTLHGGRVFCTVQPGLPDGMRCDGAGNLWTTAGDGVHVYSPTGELLGKVAVPESPANLCFGGLDGNELFITAQTGLYRVRLAQ